MHKLDENQINAALINIRGISDKEAKKLAERARKGDAHANFALSAFLKGKRT